MIYILTACLVLVFLLFFTSYLLYRGVFYYPQKKHVDPYQIPDDMLYAPYKMLCSIFSMKWSRLPMKKFLSGHRMVCLCAADFICFVRMHRLCSFFMDIMELFSGMVWDLFASAGKIISTFL